MTQGRLVDLVWLLRTQLRNRVVGMAARLRSPRYLIAFLVGIGYFVLLFSPQLFESGGDPRAPLPEWARSVAPMAIAALVLFWWVRGGYQQALAFRPEEVHLLFTAPIRRRTLIEYKLVHAQAGVLVSAILVTLFRAGEIPWPMAFAGAWVLVTTLHLHQLGSSLVRVTAAGHGWSGLRRAAVPLLIAAAIAGALLWTMGRAVRGVRAAGDLGSAGAAALEALTSPLAEAALLPFSLVLGPVLATGGGEWALAMVAAVGLLVLHLLWVLRTEAAFEEAAAEAGQRRAEIVAAMRSGKGWWRATGKDDAEVRRWLRLPLGPTGEPAWALTWSHLLGFAGDIRPQTVGVIGGSIVAVFATMIWASGSVAGAAMGMAGMAAMLAGMVFVFGPLAFRYDLRRDLDRLEMLRAFPLDPRWLVVSEIAAPVILLTVVELILLAGGGLLLPLGGASPAVVAVVVPLGILVAVNTPGLMALQVAVQNALALLFPGWVRIGGAPTGGIDAVGQGILTTLASLLAFLLLLVLPTLAGLGIGAAYATVIGSWAAIPAAMAFTGAVWLQLAWITRWLGRAYHRLDPVEAGLLR